MEPGSVPVVGVLSLRTSTDLASLRSLETSPSRHPSAVLVTGTEWSSVGSAVIRGRRWVVPDEQQDQYRQREADAAEQPERPAPADPRDEERQRRAASGRADHAGGVGQAGERGESFGREPVRHQLERGDEGEGRPRADDQARQARRPGAGGDGEEHAAERRDERPPPRAGGAARSDPGSARRGSAAARTRRKRAPRCSPVRRRRRGTRAADPAQRCRGPPAGGSCRPRTARKGPRRSTSTRALALVPRLSVVADRFRRPATPRSRGRGRRAGCRPGRG